MDLPKFVKLGQSELRLKGKTYYRDGGDWSVGYKIKDNKLFSWCPRSKHTWLHNVPLIEISKDEWKEGNGKYAPKNIRCS